MVGHGTCSAPAGPQCFIQRGFLQSSGWRETLGEGLRVSVWERFLGFRMYGWEFFFISNVPGGLSERDGVVGHPCANCQSV